MPAPKKITPEEPARRRSEESPWRCECVLKPANCCRGNYRCGHRNRRDYALSARGQRIDFKRYCPDSEYGCNLHSFCCILFAGSTGRWVTTISQRHRSAEGRARDNRNTQARRAGTGNDRGSGQAEKEQAWTALITLETGDHSNRVTIDSSLVRLPGSAARGRAASTLQRFV